MFRPKTSVLPQTPQHPWSFSHIEPAGMLVRPFSGEIETCVTDELMNSSLHLNLDGPQRAMVQSRLNTARNELEPSIRGHVRNFLSWVGNQSLNGNHVDCPCVIRLALWTLKFHSICLMVAPLSRLPISRRGTFVERRYSSDRSHIIVSH